MRILENINSESMTEAAYAHAENPLCFQALGTVKCFQLAASLIRDIKDHVPELKDDQTIKIRPPKTSHTHVAMQVFLLERVVSSVNHTKNYLQFLDHSRVLTTEMISGNRELMDALYSSDELSKMDWEDVLRSVHKCQVDASQIALHNHFPWADMEFQEAPIEWFEKEKTVDEKGGGLVVKGAFAANLFSNRRVIRLNTHTDADLQNIFNAISVIHHETIHDQGFQMGRLCFEGNGDKTGELFQDGEIWSEVEQAGAIVPCGISDAYMAQTIEKVAFAQQALFDLRIEELVNIPALKVACVTPNNI